LREILKYFSSAQSSPKALPILRATALSGARSAKNRYTVVQAAQKSRGEIVGANKNATKMNKFSKKC
jgi:hypothetical protein